MLYSVEIDSRPNIRQLVANVPVGAPVYEREATTLIRLGDATAHVLNSNDLPRSVVHMGR